MNHPVPMRCRVRPVFAGLLLVILLSGCGSLSKVRTEVTRFHRLDRVERPITFTVEPAENTDGESLAFEAYADIVASYLATNGFRRVESGGDTVVTLGYSVDGGREIVDTTPGYFSGHPRFVHYLSADGSRISTSIVPSWHYVPGRTYSVTVYRRELDLSIRRETDGNTEQPGTKIFEASAVSEGGASQLNLVMPQMISSIFQNFPGSSGETYSTALPLNAPPPAAETKQ